MIYVKIRSFPVKKVDDPLTSLFLFGATIENFNESCKLPGIKGNDTYRSSLLPGVTIEDLRMSWCLPNAKLNYPLLAPSLILIITGATHDDLCYNLNIPGINIDNPRKFPFLPSVII